MTEILELLGKELSAIKAQLDEDRSSRPSNASATRTALQSSEVLLTENKHLKAEIEYLQASLAEFQKTEVRREALGCELDQRSTIARLEANLDDLNIQLADGLIKQQELRIANESLGAKHELLKKKYKTMKQTNRELRLASSTLLKKSEVIEEECEEAIKQKEIAEANFKEAVYTAITETDLKELAEKLATTENNMKETTNKLVLTEGHLEGIVQKLEKAESDLQVFDPMKWLQDKGSVDRISGQPDYHSVPIAQQSSVQRVCKNLRTPDEYFLLRKTHCLFRQSKGEIQRLVICCASHSYDTTKRDKNGWSAFPTGWKLGGSKEVFSETGNGWLYLGRYRCVHINTLNAELVRALAKSDIQMIQKQTIPQPQFVPPFVRDMVENMYAVNALGVTCVALQCIAYDEKLARALLVNADAKGKRKEREWDSYTPKRAKH